MSPTVFPTLSKTSSTRSSRPSPGAVKWYRRLLNRLGVFLRDVYLFLRYDNLKDWLPRVWGRTFLLKTIAVSLVLGLFIISV